MARRLGSPMSRMASSRALNASLVARIVAKVVAGSVQARCLRADGLAHLLGQLTKLVAGATGTRRHLTTSPGTERCTVAGTTGESQWLVRGWSRGSGLASPSGALYARSMDIYRITNHPVVQGRLRCVGRQEPSWTASAPSNRSA